MNTRTLGLACLLIACGAAPAQNLLRNAGFEDIPGPQTGQGILPSEWTPVAASADTYSNDASYGLSPDALGNFLGVTAHSGLRWIAGWSSASEAFGQDLTSPLVPGQRYRLSGFLHEAIRSDLSGAGSYEISLSPFQNLGGIVLGQWDDTTGEASGWEARSIEFVAPADADIRPWLVFLPKSGSSAYPGLDDVELVLVPAGDCPGDVDGDGDTDVFDFADLAANFGVGPDAAREQGDLTGDGFVDVFDFAELAGDFGCGG